MAEDKANQKPRYRFSVEKLNKYLPIGINDKQAEEYVLKISFCCSILFCVDFSSKMMRVFTYMLSSLMIMLGIIYAVYFRQPIGFISIILLIVLIRFFI